MTWSIREGDVLDRLRETPSESVQCCGVPARRIPGFPGYAASADGRIWSKRTLGRSPDGTLRSEEAREWHELRPHFRKGYSSVSPCVDGRNVHRSVHVLVLLAWRGDPKPGQEACHNNGDRSDSRLSNLRWDTRAANHADKKLHGTSLHGDGNPAAKLTDEQVAEMRTRRLAGERVCDLAAAFGVHRVHASNICRGATRTEIAERRIRAHDPTATIELAPGVKQASLFTGDMP